MGDSDTKNAADAKAGRITVTDAEPPALIRAQTAQWKMVTIPLTDEQISQLKKHGVDIKQISIRTFNLSRLGEVVPN